MPQLKLIKKRFAALDQDGKGYVTVEDVLEGVPNMSKHSLAEKLMETLPCPDDSDLPEEAKHDYSIRVIDFHEFVQALDLFQRKNTVAKADSQLKFLFRAY